MRLSLYPGWVLHHGLGRDLDERHTRVVVRDRPLAPPILSAEWPAALASLSAGQAAELVAACRDSRVDVLIPAQSLLRLTTRIPNAAPMTTETVRYALMTDAPLTIDKIAFDWRPAVIATRSTPDTGWTEVVVVACRPESLDACAANVARLGLVATRIGAPETESSSQLGYTLRRGSGLGSGWAASQRRPLLVGSLATTAAAGLLAIGLAAQWQEQRVQSELAQLMQRQRDFAPTMQRWARLEAIRSSQARLTAAPSTTQLLNEFARLTPQQAWLSELRIEDGRIKATGHADNPARIATSFSGSGVVANVRLEAINATDEARSGFELSALAGERR